ncbi:MAG: baseplate J/gp47 family protein, partial [Acidobacteriia bacterium]|nr:baseplate J/gp47 family protein [Terriglobia bacterium]
DNFAVLGNDRNVYIADRISGTITFAPAARTVSREGSLRPSPEALAVVPPGGREVRLWYRTGGGSEGNVAANAKWSLKDPVPGVEVTNPEPATGGRPAETLENALIRGPQQIYSLERVVTARDYELVAQQSGAVARAKAITLAQLWRYAAPGTVEVLLVPFVAENERRDLTFETLRTARSEQARADVQTALDLRKPLATVCRVTWARYKVVRVTARVVAYRQENLDAMRSRINDKLRLLINPLPTPVQPQGWRFGEPVRAFHIFDSIVSEPGVSYVDKVRLLVDEVPAKDVLCVVADPVHTGVWYAAADSILFRSTNDTAGWEPAGPFDATVRLCAADIDTPGFVAVVTHAAEDAAPWGVQITKDSGESWELHASMAFPVRGLAWFRKEQSPALLLATERGLFELGMEPDSTPVQVTVDPHQPDAGLYAVAVGKDGVGGLRIAVAIQDKGGVYLADDRPSNPFRSIGLSGEDIRVLAVQYLGVRSFLWAGAAAPGTEGDGCRRWELTGPGDPPEKWTAFSNGWKAGSCFGLAFQGQSILAASHHGGVLRLENGDKAASWHVPDFACGLPQRETGRLETTTSVAAAPGRTLVLTSTPAGAFLSTDGGLHFALASATTFTETVTIPNTWLFVSGTHEIEVVSEDAG